MPYSYDLRFAGIRIRILAPRSICLPDNLRPFLKDGSVGCEPDWLFEVFFGAKDVTYTENDDVQRFRWKDEEYFLRIVPADGNHTCRLFVPEGIADKFCLRANWLLYLMVDRLLLPYERIILHSSAVMYKGEAILFTAPSGMGKSTQASLWEAHLGAEVINGDKVILSADETPPVAYGGPIAGTSGIYKDVQAPIRAIVYLHQGENNRVEFLDRRHAFMALYSQAVKSPSDMEFNQSLLAPISKIVGKVPVIDFFCKPDASAVTYLLSHLNHIPAK